MNLDEKIKEILEEYIRQTLTNGKGEPLVRRAIRQLTIAQLKQLFIQEAKACLPEKRNPYTYSSENSREHIIYCDGFNKAISQAEQNINKLSEEGENGNSK